MENKDLLIELDPIDIDNVESSTLVELSKQIKKRNETLDMWRDYYDGGGLQWSEKGQITRSGYQIVDKLTREIDGGLSTGANIQKIGRKVRWAEANVIDFAIDEAARAVRGEGEYEFNIKEASEQLNEEFNTFWANSKGDYNIPIIVKRAKTFGFVPVFIMENKFILQDPYNFVFIGDEDDETTFMALESKQQKGWQINGFFLNNFEIELDIEPGKDVLFTAIYTYTKVKWFADGELIHEYEHNLEICPVRRFYNPGGSEIPKDIPYQDNINIILSETSAVFKAHLNPAVVIKDNDFAAAAAAAQAGGEPVKIERGPATVMITQETGSVDYIQWTGLPTGTLETLEVYERHFYNKKGISLFSKGNGGLVESAAAKREARATLRSIARDFRDSMNITLQEICNVWLAYKGYLPTELEISEAPLDKLTEIETQELEQKHWTIHQDKKAYMERTGQFTDSEIEDIENNTVEEVITT